MTINIPTSLEAMQKAMRKKSNLMIEDVENIGIHYAQTLKVWRDRFNENWDEIKKDMVIAFKDKEGNLTEMVPGKYESIKIVSILLIQYLFARHIFGFEFCFLD